MSEAGILRITRRHFFEQAFGKAVGIGIGSAALTSLLERDAFAQQLAPGAADLSGSLGTHSFDFAPRAKRVIYLQQNGGVPHVDLFDYKPQLEKFDGQPIPDSFIKGERFAFIRGVPKLQKTPFRFRQHGESGMWLSNLLPHTAKVVDDLAFVRSMHTTQFNHGPAQIFQMTGFQIPGRPAFGSWISYGVGSESKDLPAFVVMISGNASPCGGAALWDSGFLPTTHQGVAFQKTGDPIKFLSNPEGVTDDARRKSLDLIKQLNSEHRQLVGDPEIDTRIAQYEMAFAMQASVPGLMDLGSESQAVLDMYGVEPGKPSYAANCLYARRLAERGVRFIQVVHRTWDMHGLAADDDLINHCPQACVETDRASAALITDLKQRGMLDDTLVVWASEFGRTPVRQEGNYLGRDHHPKAYTIWMAGGGVKGGVVYGATDEFGYNIAEHPVSVHDVNATILRLLGVDHTKLTYKFAGRNFRLTDVEGEPLTAIMAV